MVSFRLGQDSLDPETLWSLAKTPRPPVKLEETKRQELESLRNVVDRASASGKQTYGINTGFGYLASTKVPEDKLEQLQLNLIRSHACGVGEYASDEVVRGVLVLRAHTFALGYSGITLSCMDALLCFLEHDILPLIPMKGSVGASGDLAPLGHLALGLCGEGRVSYQGNHVSVKKVLEDKGLSPFKPSAKEGLSLINGTHFMTTLASQALVEANAMVEVADTVAALSLEAVRGSLAAFDDRIHAARPHSGQVQTATNIRRLFETNSEIQASHKECDKVQDPYSFRCIPQVHGATRQVISHAYQVLGTELNSVTDNPLVVSEHEVISGGNFHGQPIAMVMDYLCMAVSELGSISERRIEKMTNPSLSDLPPFVTRDSGLNSGYMIPHVVAAALASENKSLCFPASVDSIPTSADKEDHVSMGPIAARMCLDVIKNVHDILAIELLAACQALDLLAPLKSSKVLESIREEIRELSPFMDRDRSLHEDIRNVSNWIGSGGIRKILEAHGLKTNEV